MAQYKYKVANASGQVQICPVEAENEQDAVIKLRERGFTVLKLAMSGGKSGGVTVGGGGMSWAELKKRFFSKRFDVCEFTGKLVPLLEAHVPLARALQIVYDGSENPAEREVVANLRRGLQEGKRFSELLRQEPGKFPVIYSSLAEVGEESGELITVMKELQRFLSDGREMRDFLVTSSIYPLVLLGVTFLVILVIFVFFLPYFANIFVDMGRELPKGTQILLGISNLIINYWWLWIMGISGGGWYLYKLWHTPEKRTMLERKLLKMPLVGKLIQTAQMSRFFRTLAILFQSHVHLLTSIRIAIGVLDNSVIKESFSHMAGELRGGGKLSDGMRKSEFIHTEALQMLQVGEESGEVGNMLTKVAQAQENRLKLQIKRLLALFEPVVLVVLAIVILIVVLTVFMTILEMNEF